MNDIAMNRMRTAVRRMHAEARSRWRRLPATFRRLTPFVVVLLVGLFLGSTLLGRGTPPDGDGQDGILAGHGHDDGAEGVEWTCSMHPQIRQPGPGSCPICGMDLIPVSTGSDDGDHGDLPRLTVSDRAAALMAIQVWPAERRDLDGEIRLSGTIGYDETAVHDVVVRTEGQIERLYVNYENAAVRRGQRLADVYSPAILTASQELLQARRAAERGGMADLVEAAAAQLLALGVSRAQVDRILDSGEPARTYALFAPADGVVSDLTGRQGEWLMSGARLMRVAGLGRVWAQFEAYERDLARLRVGAPLQFTVESFPGETFAGTISFIDPVVDGGRRTVRIRVQLDNPGARLKPGMLVRGLAGGTAGADAALVIPATAPLLTGSRALVYVQLPGEPRPTFEAREVTLGARSGPHWEVAGGLTEGELVVVNGAFRIDSELQIRGRPSMMGAPPTHDHGPVMPGDSRTVPVQLSRAAGVQLEQVAVAYLEVANALSRDDAAATRMAARGLGSALRAAELADLDRDAGREWNRVRADMRARAAAMASGSDLELLRRELLPLSEALEGAVNTFQSDQVGPLFRATCPMVDGGVGSWLTRVETIENPYHGASMFTCGSVEGQVAG
jgi:membrane fusion protein, copper/silver efflux system